MRVALKMKSAGEETALLEDAGDVADWASVASWDVGNFGRGVGGAGRLRWKALMCFGCK